MTVFSAQELLQRHNIQYVATRKRSYTTSCPTCGNGYLNVEIKNDGVVWFCHICNEGSGEKFEQPDSSSSSGLGPIKAAYDYTDENAQRLFQVLRFEPLNAPKQFRQRTGPDQEKWSIKGVRIVPFMLPEVLEAIEHERVVFVCEGEKDVLRLRSLNIPATCNPMGAGKWRPEFNELLRGADVVVCTDNDQPGRDHGRLVADNLAPVVKRLRVLDLAHHWPAIEQSDDISDWLDADGTVEELWSIIEQLPNYDPVQLPPKANGKDHEPAPIRSTRASHYTLPTKIPPRAWLDSSRHYVRRVVTATVAPGGFGKTTLALYDAIEMAVSGLRVWYISGEDPREEIDRRIAAHCQQHSIVQSQIEGLLFIDDRETWPIVIGKAARNGVQWDEDWLKRFEEAILADKIDVVVLDPFVSFHGVPENDNGSVDALVKRLAAIAGRCNCCIEISHHVRKAAFGQTELTVDDTRGGSAIVNAVRSCRVINRMSEREADLARVSYDKRSTFLRLDKGKRNMAPPEAATWFELKSVHLENGDNVQAIEPWAFPNAFDAMSTADVAWVESLLRERPRRASSQSEDWLGHCLGARFERDTTTKAGCIWANKIIGTWLQNGVFKKVLLRDPERKLRPFYTAKDYKPPPDPGATIIPFPGADGEEEGDA